MRRAGASPLDPEMKTRTSSRVKQIVRALKPYEPERVILFGSAARGDADRYSDVDIVVIKETAERFLDRLARVYDLIQPNYALDALVYTPQEFAEMQARGNPFVEEILQDGIAIYDCRKGAARKRGHLASPRRRSGMRKEQAEEEGRRWLEQAQSDLQVAKWNEQGNYHSAACFWAQQTAERALKAFLYFRGKRRVIGHSVHELAKQCARLDSDFAPLIKETGQLDRYYIPTRYPNGLPGGVPAQMYQAKEAQEALELAEKTVTLVATKMTSTPETKEE